MENFKGGVWGQSKGVAARDGMGARNSWVIKTLKSEGKCLATSSFMGTMACNPLSDPNTPPVKTRCRFFLYFVSFSLPFGLLGPPGPRGTPGIRNFGQRRKSK